MNSSVVRAYAVRIEAELTQNILPFWMKQVVDQKQGTFVGEISNDLVVDPTAARGALLSSRILWTYSAAFRKYHNPAYLEMARRAYDDLEKNFRDHQHGGYFWSIAADGTPLRTRKQVYGQAFAIYALTEYYQATGQAEPLAKAIELFRLLEKKSRDTQAGGYLEAFSREWNPIEDMRLSVEDQNEPKSQNTHLHVMEAFTNLMRVWPQADLKQRQAELITLMVDKILDSATHHLNLFFAMDWTPRSEAVSYGHDIEASWLLMEAAEVLDDPNLVKRLKPIILKIADVTLAEGIDSDGALYNEGRAGKITDSNKEWWPQAEAVVGFLNAYQYSKNQRYLDAALRCWDFIELALVDIVHGEWFRGVTKDGTVLHDQPKVSFWKCPYHNGRTCLEAATRLRAIAASGISANRAFVG